MIKAVIFDFGGVVVADNYNRMVQLQLSWLKPDQIKEYREAENLAGRGRLNKSDLLAKYQTIFTNNLLEQLDIEQEENYRHPDKKILDLLTTLKSQGFKVGLLSNNFTFWVSIIKRMDYLRLFDGAMFSSDVGLVKPEKEIYLLMAQRLGVFLEECAFIDDQTPNVIGAKDAGMGCSILYRGYEDMLGKLKQVLV